PAPASPKHRVTVRNKPHRPAGPCVHGVTSQLVGPLSRSGADIRHASAVRAARGPVRARTAAGERRPEEWSHHRTEGHLMFQDLLVQLHSLVSGLEPWQQLLALVPVGAIPFIESYLGSFLGTTLGIHPALAIPAAVLGN